MKRYRHRSQAAVSIWDLFIVLLVFVVIFLVYMRGFVDPYLSDQLKSTTVFKQEEPETAPEAPKTDLERIKEARANRPKIEVVSEGEVLPPPVAEPVMLEQTDTVPVAAVQEEAVASPPTVKPGVSTPMPTDLAKLDPRFWPKTVTLRKATEFPVVFNGRVAGKATVPVGAEVDLVRVESNAVTVKNREAVLKLSPEDTDFRDRAKAIFEKFHQ